ncbi:MAG: RNA polymerase sigma factor region1.1 domain-containing protein, partial [Thermomicrobiales bacterium]
MDSSLLIKGKDQGYLLSDEIIAAFPNAEEQLDSLEEFYSAIVAEGIEVFDQKPATPVRPVAPAPSRTVSRQRERQEVARIVAEDSFTGVGDSVRLYLQEIGETSLLTMEEEVWLST